MNLDNLIQYKFSVTFVYKNLGISNPKFYANKYLQLALLFQ